jgi:hypothetical protein
MGSIGPTSTNIYTPDGDDFAGQPRTADLKAPLSDDMNTTMT